MTRPPSGRTIGLRDAPRVDDPTAARLLLDEGFRAVLGAFVGRERGVAEAAAELRMGLDAALYRVRRLRRAGLLVVAGARARGGRPVTLYRAAHDAWFVPFEVLPYADLEETFFELHVAQARTIARATARALQRSAWSGYVVEHEGDGRLGMRGVRAEGASLAPPTVEAGGTDAMVELRLAPADARRLNDELVALLQRYVALDRPDEGPANRILSYVSVPLGADA